MNKKLILKELEKAWNRCSDLRLGQLLENLARTREIDLFYLEDIELLRLLKLENV